MCAAAWRRARATLTLTRLPNSPAQSGEVNHLRHVLQDWDASAITWNRASARARHGRDFVASVSSSLRIGLFVIKQGIEEPARAGRFFEQALLALAERQPFRCSHPVTGPHKL